jgi:FMN reductase
VIDVITIAGSPSAGSRSAAVLAHARRTIERSGLRTRALSVRDLPPEDLVYGRVDSPAIREWAALLNLSRAVIVATPVYKAAYSGVLKAFLDLLPQGALAGKLVLPIATGGSPAHMLAIDYALRPVLAALSAQHILSGVYITDAQVQFDDGEIQLDPAISQRLDGALNSLVEHLGPVARSANGRHAPASHAA